jgi:hypothetical protein
MGCRTRGFEEEEEEEKEDDEEKGFVVVVEQTLAVEDTITNGKFINCREGKNTRGINRDLVYKCCIQRAERTVKPKC